MGEQKLLCWDFCNKASSYLQFSQGFFPLLFSATAASYITVHIWKLQYQLPHYDAMFVKLLVCAPSRSYS